MSNLGIRFEKLPFNPENFNLSHEPKGTVHYIIFDNYKICAITGSPADDRGGCKSVFWTEEDIKLEDFRKVILSIPIAKRLIDKMPFVVKWDYK